jgi:SAM-dependent methyltransferase
MEGSAYDLYECRVCEASFCDPLKSDSTVYEYIYAKPEIIPGYERYVRYSKLVKEVGNPLRALSQAENTYWSISEALKKYFPAKEHLSIAEIGSGLGYLTYSMNKSGYKTKGFDISVEAIAKAKEKYGNYYEAGDLFLFSKQYQGQFDCVVMTELIEHVENPKAFVEAALTMLKPDGKLILTTPNKSWTPKGYMWGSDVPPVHLWWFSEKSIEKLASLLGKKIDLLDFTPFTSRFYEPQWYPSIEDFQKDIPKMSKEGKYISKTSVNDAKSKFLSVKVRYILSYLRRRLKRKHVSARSSTMCAIIY